ncbi:lysozyme inhibitor LprI family protein [Xanthomonas indica]|uniref:Lysozyme inhibitor LprI family protein n=1 Tax=Xanthomonas indica TaxID=2912242 RepID=A0AAU8I6H7_9XANT|nr:lysozyme inhibitor LprI family protein [Xanthomonas indica]MCI2260969.1 lysozyme inhibitor LprI family protein [Xanthomonas indica]
MAGMEQRDQIRKRSTSPQLPHRGLVASLKWVHARWFGTLCLGALPAIALSGAIAAVPSLPSGAELLALQKDALRPTYARCLAKAMQQETPERCVDEEFAYQDGELNRVYRARMAALPSAKERSALQAAQRQWIAQIYQNRCKLPEQANPAMRLDAKQCRLATTIGRLRQLNDPQFVASISAAKPIAPSPDASPVAKVFTATGLPDATGQVAFSLGDLSLQVVDAHCHDTGGLLLRCAPATVVVQRPAGEQSIPVPSLVFLSNTADQQDYVAAYRGPIAQQGEGSEGLRYTAIVSDINGDGYDDLLLWTDFSGRLGAPAYTYYLFDPKAKRFVRSEKLAQATRGLTLSGISGTTLHLWSEAGQCKRTVVSLALHGTIPTRHSSKTIDSCK